MMIWKEIIQAQEAIDYGLADNDKERINDLDNNIVDFNSKRLEKQEIMNADFNDKLIEEIQNLIFTKCVERGYPILEDERFIRDVTIGCNIIETNY